MLKINYLTYLSLLFLQLCLNNQLYALTVEAEGSAEIVDNNISLAREIAHQSALRQAAMTAGVEVFSETSSDNMGAIRDSLQLRSHQNITSSKIIYEDINENILTVTIEAKIVEAEQSCDFTTSQYRKRIAATYFPILHPEHIAVTDFYNMDKGVSRLILKKLRLTGNFLTREASDINFYDTPEQAPYISQEETTDDNLLTRFANHRNVQYVISGIIRDLSTTIEQTHYFENRYLPTFKSFMGHKPELESRNIGIDIFVHDTLSGELISQNSYSKKVHGSFVIPKQSIAFGSGAFLNTEFGRTFDQIINEEVKKIEKLLSCRPFTMKVIDQKDGNLYLDAGLSSKVKVGDILTIYTPDIPGDVFGVKGKTAQFGSPKTTIRIEKVYPAYSTARADVGTFTNQDIINGYLIAW
ncbi:MAG: flagellar assembly protein T N-terminal domain-containing protein [Gammaproteobacteria bacterium]|nr:flagellar assembly protein T N-terminal domain-containing protein [Gammaproteobacteria bacterium]